MKSVAEIAEEMGFQVGINNRSQLGRFVKKLCKELAQQEEYLVAEPSKSVARYPVDSEAVRQAISDFFKT